MLRMANLTSTLSAERNDVQVKEQNKKEIEINSVGAIAEHPLLC